MKPDPLTLKVEQTDLSNLQKTGDSDLLSPTEIWEAAEAFSSPDLLHRVTGIGQLLAGDALYEYPLVVYLLSTRITEPDIELRSHIVKALGSLVDSSEQVKLPKDEVQQTLFESLRSMQSREILAILEVAIYARSAERSVFNLIGGCSMAGDYLSKILADRTITLDIRCQAARVIGEMGFMEALPIVERLVQRLESRGSDEEIYLLDLLKRDIDLLNAS